MPTQSRTTRPSSASLSRHSQSAHSGSSKDWEAGSTRTRHGTRTHAGKSQLTALPEDKALVLRSPTVEPSRRTTYHEESDQLTLRAPSRQYSQYSSSKQTVTKREDSRYESQTRGGDSRAVARREDSRYESKTRHGDSRAVAKREDSRYESKTRGGDNRTKTVTRVDNHTRGESVKSASDRELDARLKKLEEDKQRNLERQVDRLENKIDILQAQNQNKKSGPALLVYDPYPPAYGYYEAGYMDGARR